MRDPAYDSRFIVTRLRTEVSIGLLISRPQRTDKVILFDSEILYGIASFFDSALEDIRPLAISGSPNSGSI